MISLDVNNKMSRRRDLPAVITDLCEIDRFSIDGFPVLQKLYINRDDDNSLLIERRRDELIQSNIIELFMTTDADRFKYVL